MRADCKTQGDRSTGRSCCGNWLTEWFHKDLGTSQANTYSHSEVGHTVVCTMLNVSVLVCMSVYVSTLLVQAVLLCNVWGHRQN